MSSINDTLDSVRKPRIHIKYEVETDGASEEKELPFVVGVMGDFQGNQDAASRKPVSERKFINIDPDNFDQVMQNISPGVEFKVDNSLDSEETTLPVSLSFKAMEDFEPSQIVDQVPYLKKLKETRDTLKDLLTKTDRSPELEALLEKIVNNPELLGELTNELLAQQQEH